MRANLCEKFVSIHLRHMPIDQCQIWTCCVLLKKVHPFNAVFRLAYFESERYQDRPKIGPHRGGIINNQSVHVVNRISTCLYCIKKVMKAAVACYRLSWLS